MSNTVEALPFIKATDSVTVLIDNYPYTVRRENGEQYRKVIEALKAKDWQTVKNNVNTAKAVDTWIEETSTSKDIEIKNGNVYFKGEPIEDDVLTQEIIEAMEKGFPCDNLIAFLRNLMENPSYNSRSQYYQFIKMWGITINERGNVISYKAITNNWLDKHTRTIDNSIGAVVTMDRRKIDDDVNKGCSSGLHCGSLTGYVRGFASGYGQEGGDRIVLVEVNPRDVVSVPHDCSYGKVRVCAYKVIAEFTGEIPLPSFVSNSDSLDDYEDNYDADDVDSNWDENDDYTDDLDGWDNEDYSY